MSAEERFQNETVRPIIKMQHDLLITHFQHYLKAKKYQLDDSADKKLVEFITSSFQKDQQLRNTVQGLIIGHFTVDEYKQFADIASETNKRIIQITKERILNNRELFVDKTKY
mgnify:CR=1 FL=1